MILHAGTLRMLSCHTHSSGESTLISNLRYPLADLCRARRNKQGQLEPDGDERAVQNSLGFGGYEHAPKAEDRDALVPPEITKP